MSLTSYVFLFLCVKFVKVGYARNVSFEKNFSNLYAKRSTLFPLNNRPDVA